MTFTKTLYLLAACILVQEANAANTEKILNETLSKLKAIQSASYTTAGRSWEPYQKEEEQTLYSHKTIEQDCPTEPYTGCRFISLIMAISACAMMVIDVCEPVKR